MQVLIVEDDPSLAESILDGLAGATTRLTHVATGAAALAAVAAGGVDLVVLDLGLPDMDGTDVTRELRLTTGIPIIVVSARGDELDRVLALELGADDYLVKPFGMRELQARIRAVTRRTAASAAGAEAGSQDVHGPDLAPLHIDERARRVTLDGVELHLTPIEFDLLHHLSADPGAVQRRADILREVWHTEWYGATKTLDAHVAAIRRKLGDPAWIQSVRGIGFRFEVPAGPATGGADGGDA